MKPYCSEERDCNSYHRGREDVYFYQNDRGGHNSYHNGGYRRNKGVLEKRPFRGTYFKCGGEGHRAFKCHQGSTDKKIKHIKRTTCVEEELVGSHNSIRKPKKYKSLVMRRELMHGEVTKEPP